MTGMGERSHLPATDVNLKTHITDIANVLFYEDLSDVILVGHSYGGFVIPGVANKEPERIKHLVFLDSQTPKNGDAFSDLAGADFVKRGKSNAAERGDGLCVIGITALNRMGVTEPDDVKWASERLSGTPVGVVDDPLPFDDPRATQIPKTYIDCTSRNDKNEMAKKGWNYISLPTGHDAMITAPEELTETLIEIAEK
jgi:pimeloyl-ACP methyl ester carboxylesterase